MQQQATDLGAFADDHPPNMLFSTLDSNLLARALMRENLDAVRDRVLVDYVTGSALCVRVTAQRVGEQK